MASLEPDAFNGLRDSLASFLALVEQEALPKSVIATHLRYPKRMSGTITGSDLGARLWDSNEGTRLIDAILTQPQLNTWFSKGNVAEIQGRIASLVERWDGAASAPAAAVAEEWCQLLLDDLLIPAPTVERYALLFGVEIDAYCELGTGVGIRPIKVDEMPDLLRGAGAAGVDCLRLPSRPACLAIVNLAASRNTFGAFAATHSAVWGFVEVEYLSRQLWMATGEVPTIGDQFIFERPNFPVNRFERQAPKLEELHRRSAVGSTLVEPSALVEIVRHDRCVRDDDSSASAPLQLLLRYVDLTHRTVDPIAVVTLGYGALDGFLRRRGEPDSFVARRFAAVIANDASGRRSIRSVVESWYQLRSFMSHGEHGSKKHVDQFLRGVASTDGEPRGDEGDQLIRRCRELLRRCVLSLLWASVFIDDDGRAFVKFSRDSIIDELETVIQRRSFSRAFEGVIPPFVREIAI